MGVSFASRIDGQMILAQLIFFFTVEKQSITAVRFVKGILYGPMKSIQLKISHK